MRFRTSWARLLSPSDNLASRRARQRRSLRPIVEALEDRLAPAHATPVPVACPADP